MYEGLTKLDKDLKTVPGAAEKWEYNADATELTFTLQHGPEVQRRHAAERRPLRLLDQAQHQPRDRR